MCVGIGSSMVVVCEVVLLWSLMVMFYWFLGRFILIMKFKDLVVFFCLSVDVVNFLKCFFGRV